MFTKQLNILATLAAADGEVDEIEVKLMKKIAHENQMSDEEIDAILSDPQDIDDLSDLNDKEKFDLLYYVVQLTKIDHKVFNEEILYSQQVAAKLGFPLEVIMEIYPHVNTHLNLSVRGERAELRQKVSHLLNK